ncbi:MAG: MFS transporter [Anaerolineaceae bacterium]|nr:MFS transporter [Chloroflexota bacterium]MCY4008313.1 MFS transporter [Anaerolineaceae bacterium]
MAPAPRIPLRTFYWIAFTQTISILGSTLAALSIGIWIYAETGDVSPFAIISAANILPSILLGSHLGWIADRFNRRLVMAFADLGQALVTLLLLISFTSGAFQIWHLYLLAFVSATFRFLQEPAFRAAITTLVPADHRTRANAIMEMQNPLAGIIAPALAGILYASIGVVGALFADLASFSLAFLTLLWVRFPPQENNHQPGESIWHQAWAGWRFILASRLVFVVFSYFMLANFIIGGVLNVLIQPYFIARTGSEESMGILMSILNVGMILGGFLISMYKGQPRMWVLSCGICFICIGVMLMGLAQAPLELGLVLFIFGMPVTMINALSVSLWQAKVPLELQGRFFAARMQFSMLFLPLAYFLTGYFTDQWFEPAVNRAIWHIFAPFFGENPGAGMGLYIFLSGLVAMLATLPMLAFPKLRRFEQHIPKFN